MDRLYSKQVIPSISNVLIKFAQGIASPVILFFIGKVIDSVAYGSVDFKLLLFLLLFYCFQNILDFCSNCWDDRRLREIERVTVETHIDLFQSIPVENFELSPDSSHSAYILDKFGTRYRIESFKTLSNLASVIPAAAGYLWIVSTVGGLFAGLAACISIVLALSFSFSSRNESEAWSQAMPHFRFCKYLSEILTTRRYYPERKVFSYYDYIQSKWENSIHKFQSIIRKANTGSRLFSGGIKFASFVSTVVLLWFVVQTGSHSKGQIVSIAMALWAFSDIVESSIFNLFQATRQLNQYKKHFSNLASKRTDNDTGLVLDKNFVFESLVVDQVSFTYPSQTTPTLNNVSFQINKGDSFALVGVNGSGKSTLVKIILGFLTPTKGTVRLNGIDIRDIEPASLYRVMNALLQDSTRFELKVSSQLPATTYCRAEVDRLLRRLGEGKSFISKLPQQEESLIGEKRSGSVNLSGGEWQRLAVVRLLMSESDFIILDEPTSNLDAIAEQNLYQLILDVMGERTSLMITHRLGSTRNVDQIVVLDRGRVVEIGNHNSLMSSKGFYYKMYETQKSNYVF